MRAVNLYPWREKKREKEKLLFIRWIAGLSIVFVLANSCIFIIAQTNLAFGALRNKVLDLELSLHNCHRSIPLSKLKL